MLSEYLLEADPVRIAARKRAAARAGRPYSPYRFWRAAEYLRLMAQVRYVDGRMRRPVAGRRFVAMHLDDVPPVCADSRRMEWAIKEVFNNALSASCRVYVKADGKWVARPLKRHAVPNPSAAIHLELQEVRRRVGWRRRRFVRLRVRDEGVGIKSEHMPYVALWAYSPRRAEYGARSRRRQKMLEIQIGGKGIGLPYARNVVEDHGGTLEIVSKSGEGTCVTIALPVPTPLRV